MPLSSLRLMSGITQLLINGVVSGSNQFCLIQYNNPCNKHHLGYIQKYITFSVKKSSSK